jgi:hypothetical protein
MIKMNKESDARVSGFTVAELISIDAAIGAIFTQPLPPKISYRLGKIKNKVEEVKKNHQRTITALYNEFRVMDDKGNFVIPASKTAEYNKKVWEAEDAIDDDVSFLSFQPSDFDFSDDELLKEKITIPAGFFAGMNRLIQDKGEY